MDKWNRLNLRLQTGHYIHLNVGFLEKYKEELVGFLLDKDYMNNLTFAKNMMMSQGIKSNNAIEGINNDLTIIDEVIDKRKVSLSKEERKRIVNLYHGYQYILTHKKINKENLKELYDILSDGLLDEYSFKSTGEFYRTEPVYIKKRNFISLEPYEGVEASKIDYYMDNLFEYINDDNKDEVGIDSFIRSQIMHFFFVYVHPYMDVNGRTSRTMSMWYLLNKEVYPYIIFNRAIAYSRSDYETYIVKSREYGDVTLFLKYMLENVQKELEKEHIISNISNNVSGGLTKDEHQMIEYFFETKGNLTAKDFSTVYNDYNEKKPIQSIVEEKILPLVDKGIFEITGYTKSNISSGTPNMWLRINPNIIDIDSSKIKYLKLNKYTKNNI